MENTREKYSQFHVGNKLDYEIIRMTAHMHAKFTPIKKTRSYPDVFLGGLIKMI